MKLSKRNLLVDIAVVLLVLVLTFRETSTLGIKLQNNKYTGLVIAIHRSIPQDDGLIQAIKDAFTSASRALCQATKNRAYFANITILLPKTWNETNYPPATDESFSRAAVRVDKPSPVYGNTPYVKRAEGCGKPGEYLHLTAGFLTDPNVNTTYGPIGRVLVHEWGHLRWGLFDEYASEDANAFYIHENGEVQATRCSLAIRGAYRHKDTREECRRDPTTALYEAGCRFEVDRNSTDATGSIMYAPYLDTVFEFCHGNESGDPLSYHNSQAPSPQNLQCGGRSAWDVMLEHPDFAGGANRPDLSPYAEPNFRVVRSTDRRVVLVLDVSGSMTGQGRMERLRRSVSTYILSTIEDGAWLGIVTFRGTSHKICDLEQLNGDSVREEILNMTLDGLTNRTGKVGTNITRAVTLAVQILGPAVQDRKLGDSTGPRQMILITDGRDRRLNNSVIFMLQNDTAKGVVIDTIALGDGAEEGLPLLSEVTGGQFFFSPDSDAGGSALDDALTATVLKYVDDDSTSVPVSLATFSHSLGAGETLHEHIYIDSSVGDKTEFRLACQDCARLNTSIIDPDDVTYSSADFSFSDKEGTMQLRIEGKAKAGRWRISIQNKATRSKRDTTTQSIQIDVTSKPDDPDNPTITLTCHLSNHHVILGESPDVIAVRADLRKGYTPVLSARVAAIVESTSGNATNIPLLDNGVGADVSEGDGVYSAYLLVNQLEARAGKSNRYTVSIQADNEDNNAVILSQGTGAMPRAPLVNPDDVEVEIVQVSLEQFQRKTSGGAIVIEVPQTYVQADHLDVNPSAITDLRVSSVSNQDKTITLSWTAVGDDYTYGTASYYDIRMSDSLSGILSNLEDASRILQENVKTGNLSAPREAGQKETFTISLPDVTENATLYISVRAIDVNGNAGSPSRPVVVSLIYIPPLEPSTAAPDDWPTGLPLPATVSSSPVEATVSATYLAAGVAAGTLVVLSVVIVLKSIAKRYQASKGKSQKFVPDDRSRRYIVGDNGHVNGGFAMLNFDLNYDTIYMENDVDSWIPRVRGMDDGAMETNHAVLRDPKEVVVKFNPVFHESIDGTESVASDRDISELGSDTDSAVYGKETSGAAYTLAQTLANKVHQVFGKPRKFSITNITRRLSRGGADSERESRPVSGRRMRDSVPEDIKFDSIVEMNWHAGKDVERPNHRRTSVVQKSDTDSDSTESDSSRPFPTRFPYRKDSVLGTIIHRGGGETAQSDSETPQSSGSDTGSVVIHEVDNGSLSDALDSCKTTPIRSFLFSSFANRSNFSCNLVSDDDTSSVASSIAESYNAQSIRLIMRTDSIQRRGKRPILRTSHRRGSDASTSSKDTQSSMSSVNTVSSSREFTRLANIINKRVTFADEKYGPGGLVISRI
ncbi:calcium-activated chloride channel regulator 4-like [Branchiostoma floridae]|uniref:Calcium-activated chloride channel regulator 4-like n=1 Tax=Branchiostoma floridae TaxID=7739 RepID=A0A9J7L662_BRAFL|nr:calcium-activated chloride channel regulator 4-like [Branchiostoma floridae]